MYLNKLEERMLSGEYGEAVQKAIKLIVRVGEALEATKLIEIVHAHVSGISYANIGDAGLEFIRDLEKSGGRVKVYSTFNPIGTCFCEDQFFLTKRDLVKQSIIIKSLIRMGFKYSATCIPFALRKPRIGEHLSWGESSAVAIANTLFGARTNREGGPLALASALTGRTYYWGLHIESNRKPSIAVRYKVDGSRLSLVELGLLGYIIGKDNPNEIPYIDVGIKISERGAYQICAAAAASGNIAMCVIRGLSPEDKGLPSNVKTITITSKDIEIARGELETTSLSEVDVFFTGCPHLSPMEVYELATRIISRGLKLKKPLWISLPGYLIRDRKWYLISKKLRRHNIWLLFGTCPVVAKLKEAINSLATDSIKTAFYLPRRHGIGVSLASIGEFIRFYSY